VQLLHLCLVERYLICCIYMFMQLLFFLLIVIYSLYFLVNDFVVFSTSIYMPMIGFFEHIFQALLVFSLLLLVFTVCLHYYFSDV
jgi:hypothetical protein